MSFYLWIVRLCTTQLNRRICMSVELGVSMKSLNKNVVKGRGDDEVYIHGSRL